MKFINLILKSNYRLAFAYTSSWKIEEVIPKAIFITCLQLFVFLTAIAFLILPDPVMKSDYYYFAGIFAIIFIMVFGYLKSIITYFYVTFPIKKNKTLTLDSVYKIGLSSGLILIFLSFFTFVTLDKFVLSNTQERKMAKRIAELKSQGMHLDLMMKK